MQLKLLILDFDGTLADTRQANAKAYVAALKEFGYELTEADYLKRYFGMRCPEFLRALGCRSEEEIDRIRRRKIALYPAFFDSVRINRPLLDFSRQFRAQGGKVWIVSTGQPENLRNAMRYLGLEDAVDGLIAGHDVTRHKPSPDGFLLAMERAGATPAETLIFEDSAVGIEAARRSGALYVQVDLSRWPE